MALFKFSFVRVFLIYPRQKLHTGKNQKLPFYKNKDIDAHVLAQANLETSTQLLMWELMNPVLKMIHSLNIIQWPLYPKGLAGIRRIAIRKTLLAAPPLVSAEMSQAWKHLYVRHGSEPSPSISEQVRNSWSGTAENRKHQEYSSSTEQLWHSLLEGKNTHKCYYIQTRIAWPCTQVDAFACMTNCWIWD